MRRKASRPVDPRDSEMRLEMVPLSVLATWPGNPKAHDAETLGESFERFGFIDPVIVDEGSGKIVAGHGRREKLIALKAAHSSPPGRVRVRGDGEWLIPVLRGVRFKNEHEAEAYLLTSNQSVIAPGYNEAELSTMLERHRDNISGLGWSEDEIAEIVKQTEIAIEDDKPIEVSTHKRALPSSKPPILLSRCPSCGCELKSADNERDVGRVKKARGKKDAIRV